MPWQELPIVETIWQQLETVAEPTNPSSFTLALVGVTTYLCYQILVRPGHERRRTLESVSPIATPEVTAEAAATEDRRVA